MLVKAAYKPPTILGMPRHEHRNAGRMPRHEHRNAGKMPRHEQHAMRFGTYTSHAGHLGAGEHHETSRGHLGQAEHLMALLIAGAPHGQGHKRAAAEGEEKKTEERPGFFAQHPLVTGGLGVAGGITLSRLLGAWLAQQRHTKAGESLIGLEKDAAGGLSKALGRLLVGGGLAAAGGLYGLKHHYENQANLFDQSPGPLSRPGDTIGGGPHAGFGKGPLRPMPINTDYIDTLKSQRAAGGAERGPEVAQLQEQLQRANENAAKLRENLGKAFNRRLDPWMQQAGEWMRSHMGPGAAATEAPLGGESFMAEHPWLTAGGLAGGGLLLWHLWRQRQQEKERQQQAYLPAPAAFTPPQLPLYPAMIGQIRYS